MSDDDLLKVYEWIDSIPLSREKKNIARDFCDGALTAEIMKHYYPKLVDVYNYPEAYSTEQKIDNWNTLCIKVFKKIGFSMTDKELLDVVNSKPKAIEHILWKLYNIIVLKKKVNKKNEKNEKEENEEKEEKEGKEEKEKKEETDL